MTPDPAVHSEQSKTRDYAASAIALEAGVLQTVPATGEVCVNPRADRATAHALARDYVVSGHGWVAIFDGDLEDLIQRIDAICASTATCVQEDGPS